jgi:hypothetical protein
MVTAISASGAVSRLPPHRVGNHSRGGAHAKNGQQHGHYLLYFGQRSVRDEQNVLVANRKAAGKEKAFFNDYASVLHTKTFFKIDFSVRY